MRYWLMFWNFMQANSKSLNKNRIGGLIYEG